MVQNSHPSDSSPPEIDEWMIAALEQLAESEDGGSPEALRAFLPEIDDQSRHFILVELIKMSMAMAAESGTPRWLDEYYQALPDLISPDSTPVDLVMEEIQLRIEVGETFNRAEYNQRFPAMGSKLFPLRGSSEVTSAKKTIRNPDALPIGTTIDDFKIVRILGKGAFAHVYLARQISMARLVALKVSSGTGDEPRALAQFDHPNIVRVFDQRVLKTPDVHLLYMQFHPGGTLADVVPQVRATQSTNRTGEILLRTVDQNLLASTQVPPDRSSIRQWMKETSWPRVVAWLGIQMARALQEAHDHGVLHRDVKPANVLLTSEGIPQLADFNVSMAGAAGRAGGASSFGGSVGYMSPEHLQAIHPGLMAPTEKVGEQADLYSLGVLLWELWQGQRPFACPAGTGSWTELVQGQMESRRLELLEPRRSGTASERVLESVLRSSLASDPKNRPVSGSEMAGRLRLALYPEAALLFDPEPHSLAARLRKISPWWIASASILLPHIAAGWFNFQYNTLEIMKPETKAGLGEISIWVNSIAFPLAVGLMVWFTHASVIALRRASEGLAATADDLKSTLDLGHRAALIGGSCWLAAGIAYPLLLRYRFPDFSAQDATHFFVSLLICGGVAMIYPLFSLSLITTYVYYPQMVRPSMQEPLFDYHAKKMVARSESYLLIAALIPLLGAMLMVSRESQSRGFMLTAIAAGVVGLLGSFFAYRAIVRTWRRLGEVLSNEKSQQIV